MNKDELCKLWDMFEAKVKAEYIQGTSADDYGQGAEEFRFFLEEHLADHAPAN